MKTWRAALAVGGLWELIRFLLLYAAISRLPSPSLGSAQFFLVPLAAPVLALVAGYAVLAFRGSGEPLARLLSLAKLLEVVAGAAAVVALFLKEEAAFEPALRLVLLGCLAADLIFLFVIRSFAALLAPSHEIASEEGRSGEDRSEER